MKNFFATFWARLTLVGKILLGIILIGLIVLAIVILSRNKDENSNSSESAQNPEIAQVYEPSIGSPLPADVPAETNWSNVTTNNNQSTGSVSGASTTTPSDQAAPATTEMRVAPNAGVNPNAPIAYENTTLRFAAVLPAGSNVNEQGGKITFTTKQGTLLYMVSTSSAGSETLQSIEAQLRNSPSATNISYATFTGKQSLKFSAKEYGSGTTFIANGKIYYLLGNGQHFATFKTL